VRAEPGCSEQGCQAGVDPAEGMARLWLVRYTRTSPREPSPSRIGGLMVGGMTVGAAEGPIRLPAVLCGQWLKPGVFGGGPLRV
jgi:hypothetical protein